MDQLLQKRLADGPILSGSSNAQVRVKAGVERLELVHEKMQERMF